MESDTRLVVATGATVGARPYGLFAGDGAQTYRWRIPARPGDLQLLADLLMRGTAVADLLAVTPAGARPGLTEAVEHGQRTGWLLPHAPADGTRPAADPPAAARAAVDDPPAAARANDDDVLVFDSVTGWDGIAAAASRAGLVPIAARVHLGARVLLLTLPARAGACAECALRWYLGSRRWPQEEAQWLRTVAGRGFTFADRAGIGRNLLAREATALRAGTAQPLLRVLDADGQVTQRLHLYRHPSCGGPTDRHHAPGTVPAPARQALAEEAGVLHSLSVEELAGPGGQPYFLAGCAINTATRVGLLEPVFCFGDAAEEELAVRLSLSEGAERYATFHYDADRITVAALADLPAPAVRPDELPLFSADQYARPDFAFRPFDPTAHYPWVAGTDLATGASRYVPAEAIYPTCPPGPAGRLLATSSTGTAAHPDPARATAGALLELLERDALAVAYLLDLRLPPMTARDSWSAEAEQGLVTAGYTVHVLGLRSDVPVPMALVLGLRPDGPAPFVVKGAATAATAELAVHGALREAWRGHLYYTRHPNLLPTSTAGLPPDSIEYGLAFYQNGPAAASLARFAGPEPGGPAPQPLPDTGSAPLLAALLERMGTAGLAPVAVDVTLPEVRAAGLTVVKAVVPGLLPISFGRRPWHLGGTRPARLAAHFGSSGIHSPLGDEGGPPHFFT